MKNFKDLLVWQKAIEFVAFVYEVTKKFPEGERYGLVSQMRRSAVSIPSNISEGHMRNANKDFKRFVSIARGSCAELETQAIIAYKLDYLDEGAYKLVLSKIEEVAKMLSSFYTSL